MKPTIQSVTGFLLLLGSFQAPAVTLTWDDVVRYTQNSNPQLDASKKDWIATRLNENVATAGYLPTLSASTSLTRIGQKSGSGGIVSNGVVLGTTGNVVTSNYLGSLNGNFNIFNGFENKSKIEQAQWRSQNSYWTYVSTRSTVSYNLKEAFSNLILAQESLELSKSIEDRRESNLKLVSVRYENGRENKGSVLLAEAYYEQAKLDVIKAQDSLNVAQIKLKSLMNQDQKFDNIQVVGLIPLEPLEFANKDIPDLALETPSYQQQKALEMVAREDVTIAESNFYPSLDLSGNLTRQGESYFPDRSRERWAMALTLTIPLFDGMKDYNTRKGAIITQYAAEGRKKNALLEVIPRLKEAQNLARQSDIKYSVDEKFKKAATSRAEIARAKYNNGLITFEDWDIIESDLIQRQTTFLQSKRDRVLKYATWENILGRGAIE